MSQANPAMATQMETRVKAMRVTSPFQYVQPRLIKLQNDSGIGIDVHETSSTINSDVRRVIPENGRTYHSYKEGSQPLYPSSS